MLLCYCLIVSVCFLFILDSWPGYGVPLSDTLQDPSNATNDRGATSWDRQRHGSTAYLHIFVRSARHPVRYPLDQSSGTRFKRTVVQSWFGGICRSTTAQGDPSELHRPLAETGRRPGRKSPTARRRRLWVTACWTWFFVYVLFYVCLVCFLIMYCSYYCSISVLRRAGPAVAAPRPGREGSPDTTSPAPCDGPSCPGELSLSLSLLSWSLLVWLLWLLWLTVSIIIVIMVMVLIICC